MKTTLTVIGTRPEAIKLAPVLTAIDKRQRLENKVCVTRQHTDLLYPLLLKLGILAKYQFENYENKGSLYQSAIHILEQFDAILSELKPDLIIVQGDTTTSFIAALAGFYSRIPVAHIEAGLRTGRLDSPWPEEGHRGLIDRITTYFFAPTIQARNMLLAEGVSPDKIWVVGNTSIDAVRLARKASKLTRALKRRVIIVTVHRRENQGKPLQEICHALRVIAEQFPDVRIKFILHPNPAVRNPAIAMLSGVNSIDLLEPVDHPSFVQLLDDCTFVITDSGGIQEEAPFIGKPILVVRDTTERPEGIQAGTARLVGTKSAKVIDCCKELLQNANILAAMSKVHFPYGDGYAAERIADILDWQLNRVS